MIDRNLLEILVCPETLQPLSEGSAALVTALNARVLAGTLRDCAERPVTERLDHLLVRKDRTVAYPVRNQVPTLLADESIPLGSVEGEW